MLPDGWPSEEIKIVDHKWSGGLTGGLARASFTLVNTTKFAVRDVTVECAYFGRSGSEIGRHTKVIYDRISPAKSIARKKLLSALSMIRPPDRAAWSPAISRLRQSTSHVAAAL